ncbi:hypothetical protein [Dyadobacter pollutisoli]|uniref:Uncharacterized protein n=1 Tax=Dyadobacter pollutisoli TaxID=2910158 RepID=A0A9E8NHU6_9BACT|nr:hypothetical protein [Dyadobacter pollutisoli]WAC14936.1 hypothetical protein ON006_13420 [Dyadobacter pollutisoli]
MENKSAVFVRNTSPGLLLIAFFMVALFLPGHSSAQQRNADSISTVRKDTLVGNGEREDSRGPNIAADTAITLPRQGYYKSVKLSAFQHEITNWQPGELATNKQLFQSNFVVCTVFGIITAIAGPALFISGYKNYDIWNSNKTAAQITGGLLISGASIPLFIFAIRNRKKSKLIKMELKRRTAQN